MAVGLGALTEGLQGGIAARDKMDLNKQYKRLLSDKADMADRDWQNYVDVTREEYGVEEGTTEGFVAPQRTQLKDPALMRFGKWLGGKMGFGGQSLVNEEAPQQAIPTAATPYDGYRDGGKVMRYADGGGVTDEDRDRYARMNEEARNTPVSGGGVGAYMEDVGRHALGGVQTGFQNTISEGKEYMADEAMRREAVTESGIPAEERGERIRDYAGEGILGIPRMATAVTKDVLAPLEPLYRGAKGFLGIDGGGEAEAGGPTAPTPDPAAGASPAVNAAAGAQTQTETPNEEVAQKAIEEAEDLTAENFDYQLLADQGVDPAQLPSMNTTDWSDYRRAIFKYELGRGKGVKEAYEAMDSATVDVQMKGMLREFDKAVAYLGTGQNQAAALAIRQGFQYFPNGVDVKFGTTTDPKTGQPAIVSMGVDEETGEPSGNPMILTTERLAAMRENFSNPQAFRAWTKDGHQLQLDIAKTESTDAYRQGSLEVARSGAKTARIKAEAEMTRAQGAGGMKPGEINALSDDFRKWAQEQEGIGMYEEGVAAGLASAMDQLAQVRPDIRPNTIINEIKAAYEGTSKYTTEEGEAGVVELFESLNTGE